MMATWSAPFLAGEDFTLYPNPTRGELFVRLEHDQPVDVSYRDGTEVRLLPGSHAGSGSFFHAFIQPCDHPGNSFKPKDLENEGFTPEEDQIEPQVVVPSLQLFPDPAHGSLSVMCSGLATEPSAQLRFVDATGRIVLSKTMQGPLMALDVSHLNGFFTVVVESNGTRLTGRVIIQ
jgi:hypothetical protein